MQYNLRELEANQGENEDSGVSLSGSSNVTNEVRVRHCCIFHSALEFINTSMAKPSHDRSVDLIT